MHTINTHDILTIFRDFFEIEHGDIFSYYNPGIGHRNGQKDDLR